VDWLGILIRTVNAMIGQDFIVYALAAIGLNLHFGYTGLLNFGQVAFVAAGAYGVAVIVSTFSLPLWLGIAAGIAFALFLALLLGIPTLRLRADYLAIVTIASSEILRLLARSPSMREITNGSYGLNQFAGGFYALNPLPPGQYGFWRFTYNEGTTWYLLVGWTLVALAALLVFLLVRSPWGRVLKSIREDEDAATSLGKHVYSYKLQSLAVGGVIAALGGMMFAVGTQSVQPDNYGTPFTFFAYAALILGGTARVFGPVIGSALFWGLLAFTDDALRSAINAGYIPANFMDTVQVGQVRFMLVGLGLMLLMIFRPQGIFGDRRELALDAR
jgi:branched-chain amino acid transport system permease protein